MKKIFRTLFASFCLFFLAFLLSPQKTLAAVTINITNSPSSAAINEEFNVSFTASGLEANIQYYGKIRLGSTGGTYTKGQTKNGEVWLDDNDPWTSFPTFTSATPDGLNGTLVGRAKSTASLGLNQLFVRLRKLNPDTNFTSAEDTTIEIVQSSTPTPTASPTPTPTSTPSPTPTSTPKPSTPKPATPKPTASSTPTSIPKPTAISVKISKDIEKSPEPTVLPAATNSASIKPSPTSSPKEKETKVASENNLQKILIVAGLLFIISSGFWFMKSLKKNE